jgi:membrane protein
MKDFHGLSLHTIAKRTLKGVLADRLFGHAAELGFYFLFALFPTLFCAGSLLGLAARSVHQFSDKLLNYLALVIPTSALGAVLTTFNETAAAASSGKVTFGSIAAIWSASVGISAIQDTLNVVYKLDDRRSYITARIYAIGLTILITVLFTLGLSSMFGGDFAAALSAHELSRHPAVATGVGIAIRIVAWIIAACILALSFEVTYYWAPAWKERHWRWLTPGTTFGVVGWLFASVGFRVYIHYFNSYPVIYGSLGAVIILLMWFYISGLMLLLGAEIDNVIDAASVSGVGEIGSSGF